MKQPIGQTLPVPSPAPDSSEPNAAASRDSAQDEQAEKRRILRLALSIAVALIPFGLAFGVAASEANLTVWEAVGFSALVFTGGSQFAAVTVLGDGGTVAAALGAGMLLNLRALAYGVVMAPALQGSVLFRAVASQILIDESTAVGSAQSTLSLKRYGFLAGGLSVFVLWNITTLVGFSVLSSSGDLVTDFGLDSTIPAAFLALVWPRLSDPTHRVAAAVGAAIAIISVPLVPVGVPIVLAALGALVAKPWQTAGEVTP